MQPRDDSPKRTADCTAMNGYGPETYGESFADVYDDWYGDISDVDATVAGIAALADGGPVLELGAGTGRLAIPLAEQGLDVVAVDASPAMLQRLAAKPGAAAVRTIEADMAAPPVSPDHFSVAFVAFNTFFNLTDDDAQRRCVGSLARAVRPDGRVVIEAFVPPADGLAAGGISMRKIAESHVVLSVSHHENSAQRIEGKHIEISPEGVVVRPWRLHYRTAAQLDALFADGGFELEARHADWRGSPFGEDSDVHVSVYRRSVASS